MAKDFSIKIGGAAGSGVFTIGILISKLLKKFDYNIIYTFDFPSLIKGGHNTCCINYSKDIIYSENKTHEILIALDKLTLNVDLDSIKENGVIFSDNIVLNSTKFKQNKISFNDFVKQNKKILLNTYLFGIVAKSLIEDEEIIKEIIKSHFSLKSQEIIDINLSVINLGIEYAKNNNTFIEEYKLNTSKINNEKLILTGNDACCLGAIKSGVKFVAGYPMTPASTFLTFMKSVENDYKIIVKQTEDEIAAVNMAIGASFSGLRSMTATSGGGFALMTEAIGFAAMSENPLVIFESMRSGPSTGMPTFTEQGDLNFVLNSTAGDVPLVVLAPGDMDECFHESYNAFNIAEITQTPVLVLVDRYISGSYFTADKFDERNLNLNRGKLVNYNIEKTKENFKRYELTNDGSSPRSIPGQNNGIYVSSSYEHDETGWTCEDAQMHVDMTNKRFKKLDLINENLLLPKLYGPQNAELTLIAWGSTKGAILDAIKELNKRGKSVNYLHFVYLNPMPKDKVKQMLESCNNLMIIEGNYSGQFKDLLFKYTGIKIKNTYFKYDGRPFYYEDIVKKVNGVLN